ncbi:MAG: beta-N-acetylhexosaminidase [Gemmatimonadaceae bacterium]
MIKPRLAIVLLAAISACTSTPSTAPVPLRLTQFGQVIPLPVSMRLDTSRVFRVDTSTIVYVDESADRAVLGVAQYLRTMLAPYVRQDVQRVASSSAIATKSIRLTIDPASPNGDEGYAVDVTPDAIAIVAKSPAGLFYGVQTVRQLLPPSVENVGALNRRLIVPAGHIVDSPRFSWRGMQLDVARHFLPPRDVKRFIDLVSLYKINRVHLHLSDDQGWRIEIKSRPALTTVGGLTQVGGAAGGFFTQDDYRDIVQYAASRFITIVPEIDMPAHSNAAMVSYPELTCDHVAPPVYTSVGAPRTAVMCVDSANIYPIIDDVVREISAMTPGPWYHIGGDEVPRLTRTQYLTFLERMQSIVNSHGKQMIGWAEIAPANLSTTTIAQHWSTDSVQLHAARGGKVIMSPGPHAYLDMKYDSTTILGLKWAGFITPQTVYDWDPGTYRAGVPENAVLGVEAPFWSETAVRAEDFEFLIFPRVLAMAEVGWTPQSLRAWSNFGPRLEFGRLRLKALGVNAGN